jgi:uncharacterized protein (DUF3084 family)
MPDPFVLAISLCQIAANAKAIEPALKKLRRLGRDLEKAEAKRKAITAEIEQKQAELAARAAALDERERVLDARATEFESSLQEARDNLAGYYNHIAEADRHIRHRVLSYAGLLGGSMRSFKICQVGTNSNGWLSGCRMIRRRSSVKLFLSRASMLFRTRSLIRTPIATAMYFSAR